MQSALAAPEPHPSERELGDGDRLFRAIFENVPDAVLIVDDDARYVEANPAGLELLGRNRTEVIGLRVHDIAAPEVAAQMDLIWTTFMREGRGGGEFPVQRPDSGIEEDKLEQIRGGEHFDVILCDLMMPQMTGMELFEALKPLLPDLERRAVFLTGGAFTPGARAFLEQTTCHRLEKPFERNALLAIIRDIVR